MQSIISFFTALSLYITYLFGFGTVTVSDGYELVKSRRLNPFESLFSGQGLCCDGEYFYTSGSLTAINFTGIAKFDLDMNCKKVSAGKIPAEFREKYKSDHIGGIGCANGLIYAPVEGDGYEYNFILLYDCETLEYTGTYYDMTSERLTDGIPWCAVDRENGYLYTSMFDPVDEILQYDLETMEFLKAIPLSSRIHRIQGGSVYDSDLYLSYDCKDPGTTETIFRINTESGEVTAELVREVPNFDNEAEDVCVYPLPDGSFIHTLDYDNLICVNIMHLKK